MDAEEVEQALKVVLVVEGGNKISKVDVKGGRGGGRRSRQVLPHPEVLQGRLHLPVQENHRGRFPGEGGHPAGGKAGTACVIVWFSLLPMIRCHILRCYVFQVRLMLWDTAGQEEFDCITKAYYRFNCL